jgi:CheY-like chemotaxis protein
VPGLVFDGHKAYKFARRAEVDPARDAQHPSTTVFTMTRHEPTILIVEDDAAFAYAASRHLENAGYRTIVVGSSMAAFEKLDGGRVDLVITDVRLLDGEPHGLALGRMIGTRRPKIPVILVTAYPDILEGEALPGPVLRKPVDLSTLSQAVRTSLAA